MLQYSLHTAHQRISAGKYAVLVDTLPQLLVVLWLLLGLLAVPEYLLEEEIWNRLASHALVEELAHSRRVARGSKAHTIEPLLLRTRLFLHFGPREACGEEAFSSLV